MADLSGVHMVIVPAWWPSPEQPTAGIFFPDYARRFADAGARVGVIYPNLVSLRYFASKPRPPLLPRVEREFVREDIPVVRVRGLHTALRRPSLQMKRFRSWLARGLDAYRSLHGEPNVLHAMCSIPSGWACATLNDPLARHVLVTELFGPFSAQMTARAGASFVREALATAAAVVTVSERSRRDMREAGIDGRIDVIGMPVGVEFLDAPIARSHHNGPVRGLFVGRLTEAKGVSELALAASALSAMHECEWRFIGVGPMGPELRLQFELVNRSDRLQLLGEQSRNRIVEEMLAADFFVLPSHGETFGMAVAEALCMGLPVVTTRGTACQEFIIERNGLLADRGSVESLQGALEIMLHRARGYDRDDIATAARDRFARHNLASQYQPFLRGVAAGPVRKVNSSGSPFPA
ncbi:MAG TPA: glycosyltransferase [Phycisphaerae bacterium]|nr:glycosyltransferase [Phycisphaerae bacterium]